MHIERRKSSREDKNTRGVWLVLCGLLLLIISACGPAGSNQESASAPNGEPDRGRQAIVDYGCTSCHIVPGVPGPEGLVGPPLYYWADRSYIAGSLQNTTDNLIAWIVAPQAIEPDTAMPDMGVTEQDARDIAAYLFTLRYNDDPATRFVRNSRAFFENLFAGDEPAGVPVTGADQTETPTEEMTPEATQGTETPQPDGEDGQQEAPQAGDSQALDEEQAQALIEQGEGIFNSNCASCHQQDGQGQGTFPALAGNDFVTREDATPVIETVLHGRGAMPSFEGQLSNEEIAAVVSYIRNTWENQAEVVTEQQVQAVQEGGSAGDVSASGDDEDQGQEPSTGGEGTPQPEGTATTDKEGATPTQDMDRQTTPEADGEGQDGTTMPSTVTPGENDQSDAEQRMADGEELYRTICAACHQPGGVGVGPFPPLNNNPLVTQEDPHPVIEVVLTGRAGMPAFMDSLTHREIASVITYIRSAWDNDSSAVNEQEVEELYKQIRELREAAVRDNDN